MKKIASAVLFVSIVASANANKFTEHLGNNKGSYIAGTATTAVVGSALYYEIKYNDSKVLKAAKKLIQENPKAAAGILAAVTGTSLLTADVTRGEKSLVKAAGRGVKNGTLATGRGIKTGAVATYNGVKAAPGKVVDGVKAVPSLTVRGLKAANPVKIFKKAPAQN
jgi:hypothetical protein